MNNLPSMEHSFDIRIKGTNSGKIYDGNFIYKRLSIGDEGKAAVFKAKLNGDLKNIDDNIDLMHEMLSWLRYGIVLYPEWWRNSSYGLELYDFNVVKEIYDIVVKFENDWVKKVNTNVEPTSDISN